MWYFLQGIVPALVLAGTDIPDTMIYSRSFLFAPPSCEYQVIFPKLPQKLGTLTDDPNTWSAQLQLPNAFMRADCAPIISTSRTFESNLELRNHTLNTFLFEQIDKFGGPNLVVLNLEVGESYAKMTAQLFMPSEIVLLKTNAYLGKSSMLKLIAIERNTIRSGEDAERFLESAGGWRKQN